MFVRAFHECQCPFWPFGPILMHYLYLLLLIGNRTDKYPVPMDSSMDIPITTDGNKAKCRPLYKSIIQIILDDYDLFPTILGNHEL